MAATILDSDINISNMVNNIKRNVLCTILNSDISIPDAVSSFRHRLTATKICDANGDAGISMVFDKVGFDVNHG